MVRMGVEEMGELASSGRMLEADSTSEYRPGGGMSGVLRTARKTCVAGGVK